MKNVKIPKNEVLNFRHGVWGTSGSATNLNLGLLDFSKLIHLETIKNGRIFDPVDRKWPGG